MTPERHQRILQIADELEAEGQAATNSAVYARALGHRGHVVAVMKERRVARAEAGGVAVDEEPEDEEPADEPTETPAVVLAEDLRQLEAAYESWHASLEQIWTLEKDGPLDLHTFSRARWLEYQLTSNLQQQERLRPQWEAAKVREAVHHARDQHDARIPEAQVTAEAALQALATAHACLEDLVEVFSAQTDAFFPFRDTRGHQAFDVADGRTYALQLVQQFFGGHPHAPAAFELLMMPVTMGMLQGALAACTRLKPFSATAIATYLHSITPQPAGGPSNGQHS